jgi:hypothetical protein
MSSTLLHVSRIRLATLMFASVAAIAAVQAQTPPPAQQPAPAGKTEADKENGRQNQKIEHIHTEDSGATVDEVRVGGQTTSITVKPKNNAPAYNVMPNREQGSNMQGQPDSSNSDPGSRVWWNVFKF